MKTDTDADTVTHPEGQGRNPESRPVGVETVPASSSWTKAEPDLLMEAVVASENMQQAYRRVVANKGASGADDMTMDQLAEHGEMVPKRGMTRNSRPAGSSTGTLGPYFNSRASICCSSAPSVPDTSAK